MHPIILQLKVIFSVADLATPGFAETRLRPGRPLVPPSSSGFKHRLHRPCVVTLGSVFAYILYPATLGSCCFGLLAGCKHPVMSWKV